MQQELHQRGSKRSFSLLAFGVWLTVLASAFGFLRTIHPGLYKEDLIPLALGGCLLGLGTAMPIVFVYRVSRRRAGFFFAGLLGAVVAAALGLAASAMMLRGVLDFLVGGGGGVFEGFIVIIMPVLGACFGGLGGCAGGALRNTGKSFWFALAVGAVPPFVFIGLPTFFDGRPRDMAWSTIVIGLGVLGTLSGQWLTRAPTPRAESPESPFAQR